MVVKNSVLFADYKRENKFYSNDEASFDSIVSKNFEFMVRGVAEENREYKQPIGYAVIIDSDDNIFVYERGGKGSNAGDARLHSKISFGVGGHIEREDEESTNVLRDSLVREVEEELNLKDSDIDTIEPLGYINDDTNDVGEVHIGAAYIVRVNNTNFELLDGELADAEFVSIEKLETMIESEDYDLETWSQILFNPLKNYLNK